MSITQVNGRNIKDGTIQKKDVDIVTPGQSLITNALPGQNIIITQTGADIGTGEATISTKRSIYETVNRAGTVNNSTWLYRTPGTVASGAYAGYPTAAPILIPFNCTLNSVKLIISGATYNYRSTAGSIFIGLNIFDHMYNGTSQLASVNMEIPGSYTGTSFTSIDKEVDVTTFTIVAGSLTFAKHALLGILYSMPTSNVGQTSKIVNAYMLLEFKEV